MRDLGKDLSWALHDCLDKRKIRQELRRIADLIIPAMGPKFAELAIGECSFSVQRDGDSYDAIVDVRAYYDNFTYWGEKGNRCDLSEIEDWRDGIVERSRPTL